MKTDVSVTEIARCARSVMPAIMNAGDTQKNALLRSMAAALRNNTQRIQKENTKDLENGKKRGLSDAMLDRLALTDNRIENMAAALEEIALMNDPIGEIEHAWRRPNGIEIAQMRVPIGVVGCIYESRPNVTSDIAGLCIKSGNVCILRGGSEAIYSNTVIVDVLHSACTEHDFPEEIISFIAITDRQAVYDMLKLDAFIDIIIPRGGHGLIKTVTESSTIPVVKHDKGVCSIYIHYDAEPHMAEALVINAKCQRPGVCNAIENVLIHKDYPEAVSLFKALQTAGVELRGDSAAQQKYPMKAAVDEDWTMEYLDLIIAVKTVNSLQEAIQFTNTYGSHHSDAICTQNYAAARQYLKEVDSAAVYVNASTRFTDGGEFGLGAEVGISTQKLHCRGPMGIKDLTCLKYTIYGNGQIRT